MFYNLLTNTPKDPYDSFETLSLNQKKFVNEHSHLLYKPEEIDNYIKL